MALLTDLLSANTTAIAANSAAAPTLIEEQSPSGISYVTFDNVFTTEYEEYRLVINDMYQTSTTSWGGYLYLRSGGTSSTSDYNYHIINSAIGGSTVSSYNQNSNADWPFTYNAKPRINGVVTFRNVAEAKETLVTTHLNMVDPSSTTYNSSINFGNMFHKQASSYDGFQIDMASPNIEGGTLKLYGIKNLTL